MIDAQMDGDATMTVGWMVTMHGFDLLFEGEVFCRLLRLPIDVLAIDSQSLSTDRLQSASPDYFDFFC